MPTLKNGVIPTYFGIGKMSESLWLCVALGTAAQYLGSRASVR